MFKKILIANRGEIAVRIIRACREMGIASVAVYSQADAESLHRTLADEAVCIGPPANQSSYLNIPNIITAAIMSGADAVHPGYGNLSEIAAFAENCELAGLTFIGPPATVIEKMQDKAAAKEAMREAGVPVVPGSEGRIWNVSDAAKLAKRFGYPVMIKAAAGGGGKGIRIIHTDEDLARALPTAQQEAEASFGRPEVYLEKYLEEPRHIEVQILADSHGELVHLGERDCSIQTPKHQKVIEESPCIVLSAGQRSKITESAIRAAKAIRYRNAGTVEFLLDKKGKFYFLEMNTRIQVEHCVTEMVTGIDLVKEQIRIAAGEKLGYSQKDIEFRGHAIECRVTAEDPHNHFLAAAGKVERFRPPGGPGIRVDSHLFSGYVVPPFYDPLLAKVIAWGRDRDEAIARATRALAELEVSGLKTTVDLHQHILGNAFFRRGEVYTNFIQRRVLDEM